MGCAGREGAEAAAMAAGAAPEGDAAGGAEGTLWGERPLGWTLRRERPLREH